MGSQGHRGVESLPRLLPPDDNKSLISQFPERPAEQEAVDSLSL